MDAEEPQDGIEDGDEHGAHQSGADVGQRHLDHGDNEVGHGAVGRGGEHQPNGQKQDHHEQSRNQGLKLAGHKAGNGLRHFDLYIFLQQDCVEFGGQQSGKHGGEKAAGLKAGSCVAAPVHLLQEQEIGRQGDGHCREGRHVFLRGQAVGYADHGKQGHQSHGGRIHHVPAPGSPDVTHQGRHEIVEGLYGEIADDYGDGADDQQWHGDHKAVPQGDEILVAGELFRDRHQILFHKICHFVHFYTPLSFRVSAASENIPR